MEIQIFFIEVISHLLWASDEGRGKEEKPLRFPDENGLEESQFGKRANCRIFRNYSPVLHKKREFIDNSGNLYFFEVAPNKIELSDISS